MWPIISMAGEGQAKSPRSQMGSIPKLHWQQLSVPGDPWQLRIKCD